MFDWRRDRGRTAIVDERAGWKREERRQSSGEDVRFEDRRWDVASARVHCRQMASRMEQNVELLGKQRKTDQVKQRSFDAVHQARS